ncbi:hypothetical protein ACFLZ1_03950 [Patescibacteria group bacterium]
MKKKTLKHKLKNKLGISLIEVIVYIGLLTTVLALVTNFLYQVANFKVNNQIESAIFQNSNLAFNKISRDIKNANSITTPVDASFVNSLVLELDDGSVTYEVVNDSLQRNGIDITDKFAIVDVNDSLKGFRKIGDSVQIRISFISKQKPFGQTNKEKIYQTAFSLRK